MFLTTFSGQTSSNKNVNEWNVSMQACSVASLGRLYSDLDSGDEEESQNSRTNVKTMNAADEVDESKFFAGVFTSQRSEEDLTEYVNIFHRESTFE